MQSIPIVLNKILIVSLTRISHQTLGKLGTSVPPNIPSNSFGNVYEHSLQELLEISKKQSVQSSSRAGEKYGLRAHLLHFSLQGRPLFMIYLSQFNMFNASFRIITYLTRISHFGSLEKTARANLPHDLVRNTS